MANIPLQSISFPGLSDKYTTPVVDNTLTQTGAAADAKKTGDEIGAIKNDFNDLNGDVLFNATHTYVGGDENWRTFGLTNAMTLAIKFYDRTANNAIEVAANYGGWHVIDTISDSDWHIIEIPSNVSGYLVFTYRGSTSFTVSAIVVKISGASIESDIAIIESNTANLTQDVTDLDKIVTNIKDDSLLKSVAYPNSGYINTSGTVVTNPNFFYSDYIEVSKLDVSVDIYWHNAVATFTFYDAGKNYINKYIKVDSGAGMASKILTIPSDAVYVVVCTDPSYNNKVYTYETKDAVVVLKDTIIGSAQSYGNQGTPETVFQSSFLNFSVCNCKKVTSSGKITSLFVKSYSSGPTKLYVGEVDQLYLFIPRKSYDIAVSTGEQVIDVSDLDIYVNEGEQVLFKFIGQTPFKKLDSGNPESDASYYYSDTGSLQLQVYSAQYVINFGFGYTVEASEFIDHERQLLQNEDDIENVKGDVQFLTSNFNVISDRQGNKYKMIVQNGAIDLLPLNFAHVLCVGNSYTVHPTMTDTEADYRNNLWWGHWSMAASALSTAWTTLLQTALRQKVNNAVVTPVFGRRYETNPNTYTVSNSSTFTYWDGSAWQSLKNNVSNFSDVDAIVFFLGANYSGNDWYSLYSAMLSQFLTWFPNATLFCCSCSSYSSPTKDDAIHQAANEQSATYISMVGINGKSKIGSYVYGDDNNLHQIDNTAVAGHFGDYGEYLILDRLCNAMGYTNNANVYDISITPASGVALSVISTKTLEGAVVSVFAEVESGTTLSSITVTDEDNNNVTVTDHGATSYGRVFTFIMPSANVTITANVS